MINKQMMKGKVKIRIKGLLDDKWRNWFDGMEITHEGSNSILSGIIIDEAALHGILNKIRDLNLTLLSVNFDS
ncbi:hypothetical protein [Maribellus sediminis]|uniref:hypothetical protein n=1 Tax=Maribellus sediminis TaxID=2696285 RepID=UPI001430AF71|nr:hypothetical protein [Maribellus sediminis]